MLACELENEILSELGIVVTRLMFISIWTGQSKRTSNEIFPQYGVGEGRRGTYKVGDFSSYNEHHSLQSPSHNRFVFYISLFF